MSHGLEKHRHGYVAPIRLPPCITPVDRTARLSEQNHTGFLSRELWQDLIVFLKKTDEWKELKELHRIGRQGAEASVRAALGSRLTMDSAPHLGRTLTKVEEAIIR
eukprot:733050-Prorocentrum_minimum.AAC.1